MTRRKYRALLFLIIFKANAILGQNDCINKVEIKQLGVEFCLPDTNWTIEEEDGLKFISIHKSTLYSGTKTYTLRMEKLDKDLPASQYFEQLTSNQNSNDYREIVVSKGIKNINGKKFYSSNIHTVYESNNIQENSYSITFYYSENKIGYSLSLVVSDENKESWNEAEALKIWDSFKIISLPEDSVMN